jgi:hypothetical protein
MHAHSNTSRPHEIPHLHVTPYGRCATAQVSLQSRRGAVCSSLGQGKDSSAHSERYVKVPRSRNDDWVEEVLELPYARGSSITEHGNNSGSKARMGKERLEEIHRMVYTEQIHRMITSTRRPAPMKHSEQIMRV